MRALRPIVREGADGIANQIKPVRVASYTGLLLFMDVIGARLADYQGRRPHRNAFLHQLEKAERLTTLPFLDEASIIMPLPM